MIVQTVAARGAAATGDLTDLQQRLDAVETTSREALAEMRRMLGLLELVSPALEHGPDKTARLKDLPSLSLAPAQPVSTSLWPPTTLRRPSWRRALSSPFSGWCRWRYLVLGQSTVKTHVNRILTKLALRDRTQAVVYAYEAGLVRRGSPLT